MAVKELLEPFDHWRTGLNEIWNVAGLLASGNYTDPNVPWDTSHYGYYMSSWHVLFGTLVKTKGKFYLHECFLDGYKVNNTFSLYSTIWTGC